MAGVGLHTKIQDMRAVGATPFFLGVGTAALLATLSLLAIVDAGDGLGRSARDRAGIGPGGGWRGP